MSTIRLSLMAGTSLIAAILAASPASAANECGDPSTNGNAPDFMTCAPGPYLSGIDYSTTSDGDLTVILRDRVDTGTSNTAGTGGIRMFGDTGENISLIREDNAGGDPRIINTVGRGVDISTQGDGNIVVNLTDGDPTASEPTTGTSASAPIRVTGGTDAIRADASGTGSVNVTIAETGTPSGTNHPRAVITAGAAVGSNGSGVVARTTSGAINIDVRGASFTINGTNGGGAVDAQSATGNVSVTTNGAFARLFGVRAQTGGAGTVAVTTGALNVSGSAGVGIDTTAGTGVTNITLGGGTISGATAAIRAVSANTSATAAVNIQNSSSSISGRVDFSGVSAGGVTFNNTGANASWNATGSSVFSGFNDTVTFASNVNMAAGAAIDLGGGNDSLTLGSTTNTFASVWQAGSSIDFGTGNDTFSLNRTFCSIGSVLNFGAGTDTMNLSGVMVMDGLTINGVETFNLSGTILMGGGTTGDTNDPPIDYVTTDALANDVLRMTSGTFTGSGTGRVVIDAFLDPGQVQAGCATVSVADCLDLRGASTAGVTLVTLNYIGDGSALGSYDPAGVTIVDLAGAGTSAQGHFVLDPGTVGYRLDPTFGATVSRPGLMGYAIRYDAANKRQVLVGLPRTEILEYAILGGAAQSIWHMTSEAVTDRQADLRDGAEADALWLRASGEYTNRDIATAFSNLGDSYAVDNSYKLYAGVIMGGIDLVSGQSGALEYVGGLQAGYVTSSFDLDTGQSSGRFSGATGGVYASLWSDLFFLDGTVNINGLTLDHELPSVNSRTTTFLNSVGARAEAGVRSQLTERTFVEPLATLAYVRTSFEEISLDGGEVKPADAKSLRGALGMRVGGTLAGQGLSATYFVTGRAWDEIEGESDGIIANPGVDLTYADAFSGPFGEAELGINVYDNANTVSGFLTTGVKWKNGYSAINLSLGVRMAW